MKIWIYGCGERYHKIKGDLFSSLGDDCLMGIIDNRADEICTLDGYEVIKPCNIKEHEYDLIIITSNKNFAEMQAELLCYCVAHEKIWRYERYVAKRDRINQKISIDKSIESKVLIIARDLDYSGGTIAAISLAEALQRKYDQVYMAAPTADESLLARINNKGIITIITKALYYLSDEDLYWIEVFDDVVVNVFPMISCAYTISKKKRVLWWIHEALMESSIYERYRTVYAEYDNDTWMDRVNIAAVSSIAKNNFERFYPNKVNHILPLGIPDEGIERKSHSSFTVLLIGSLSKSKGQDVFIDAIELLPDTIRNNIKFVLVGSDGGSYADEIKARIEDKSYIEYVGTKNRDEMMQIYSMTDVVVCASRQETFSLTVVEGMMNSIPCITTDTTGVAEYIENGNNGYVVKSEDAQALSDAIVELYSHPNECKRIGENARHTYEAKFTLARLAENFETVLR